MTMKKKYNTPDVSLIIINGCDVLTSSGEWKPSDNETERSSPTNAIIPTF